MLVVNNWDLKVIRACGVRLMIAFLKSSAMHVLFVLLCLFLRVSFVVCVVLYAYKPYTACNLPDV